jgi:1-acyl-sn-glycerol-3-phosphate acyltransferase
MLPCAKRQPRAALYASTAALLVTAVTQLYAYKLEARLRGPSPERAARLLQRWCRRRAWPWLSLSVHVYGTPSAGPRIYVSNHRSYVDIPVLSGVLGATFLSRGDLATWPLIGPVAQAVGAVFVDRDDAYGRAGAARALMRRSRNASVVVFPEGTTCGSRLPGAFHPGLFRLLHRMGATVVPLTLRYSRRSAYWTEDLTLWQHLRQRVLADAPLICTVHIGAELRSATYADGAHLAAVAYQAICRPIEEHGELS